MKYLIDTDIASYYLRGKNNLLEVFYKKGVDNIRLSIVTVAELEVLAYKNPHSKINISSITFLSESLGIIEIDRNTWRLFSEMKATALFSGRVIGDFDILMAAIAKCHELILVTNNVSHYEGLITVENWVSS
ncbi:MAG: PIN domain-containing protein [bacterium]